MTEALAGAAGPANAVAGASKLVDTSPPSEFAFLQCFGERQPNEEIQDADIISTVQFDGCGEYLATGDRGGRVVLFEKVNTPARPVVGLDQRAPAQPRGPGFEYRYLTEFQSHEPEFDYLKSLEIEEKINRVQWVRSSNATKHVLSTNDKTVKLWKVFEKKAVSVSGYNLEAASRTPFAPSPRMGPMRVNQPLRFPTVTTQEMVQVSRTKRVFANAHTYHINSVSVNSDQETFLSADDLRINLWNLEYTDQSFNIVDIKPANMEDLTEVITSAEFHPSHCNVFAYSSSKGCIRLADLRSSALIDNRAKVFEEAEGQPGNKSFFSEIIASVSDIRFSGDGRFILSRDYMTLKLWDLRKEALPVQTFNVHEQLRTRLCDLYENDSIFDKFDCCMNGNASHIATGSYNNLFRVFGSAAGGAESTLEASRDPMRRRMQPVPAKPNRFALRKTPGKKVPAEGADFGQDYAAKLLHLAWHPEANVIACAAANSLYMYCA